MSNIETTPADTSRLFQEILASQCDATEQSYIDTSTGENGRVLLGTTKVIKMPRFVQGAESLRCVLFESAIINTINMHDGQPPLKVPSVIQTHVTSPPYYSSLTRVGEQVIGQTELRQFDTYRLQDYGTSIGSFVAWMESAITIDEYSDIYDRSGRPQIFDRTNFVRNSPEYFKDQPIPHSLARLLLDVRDELTEREKDGDLVPTLVGHDDLWIGNVAFANTRDGPKVEGVFDFGLTKPSSPERELRALAVLPDALETGITAYESRSGRHLSRELIGFWAVAQIATNYAGMLKSKNYAGAEGKCKDLEVLLPGVDWKI